MVVPAWAPKSVCSDPEFCKPSFGRFINSHDIPLHARTSSSSPKHGVVERNNGTFKLVLCELAMEITDASTDTLVARASFMSNLFHGNAVMSSFQLPRGYTQSVAGVTSSKLAESMLETQVQLLASDVVLELSAFCTAQESRPANFWNAVLFAQPGAVQKALSSK